MHINIHARKSRGKSTFGRSRYRLEDNIKIEFKEFEREELDVN
jgi:hypothetical protein